MNKLGIVQKVVGKLAGRPSLYLKKMSPEILVGVGIVGVVGSCVLACKSTLKVHEITEEHDKAVSDIHKCNQMCADTDYNDHDAKRDLAITYTKTAVNFVKLYAPSVVLGAASIACIIGSHNILKKRNIAIAAAYKMLSGRFDEYRDRVREDLGDDKDQLYYNGVIKAKKHLLDENGKPTKKTEIVNVVDPNNISLYARFFDDASDEWQSVPEYNMLFLKSRQEYFNHLLHSRGHVFLNEVYDELDIPRTKEGAVVGWVLSEDGDNFIDFGLYNVNNPQVRDFVNGYEGAILLDFNVDGVIYDLI